MVKNYEKKARKYDETAIASALCDIKDEKLNVSKAAEKYGINRNLLIRRLMGQGNKKRGRKPELTKDEEENLAMCLRKLSQWGFGLSQKEICDTV